ESLANPDRLAEIKALRPALVAVDEAHCISGWGYDFRPDYLDLGDLIRELGRPPVVALTATASPPVRDDIVARLGLRRPRTVVSGLDRANLLLQVAYCSDENARYRRLLDFLREEEGRSGIVYVPTRRAAEELAGRLKDAGFKADFYHGGMASGPREQRHEEFLAGRVPVMVATSAFGMGIDKPDIRWVAHVALPDSPDSYLQEIGRAGRDGESARTLLLWRAEDEALQRFFAGGAPDERELRDLVALLRAIEAENTQVAKRARAAGVTKSELRERSGLSQRKLSQLLSLLEEVGAVRTLPSNRLGTPKHAPDPVPAAQAAVAEVSRRQAVEATRREMMRGFAQTRACRSQALLAYFGEHMDTACGHCDNCGRAPVAAQPAAPASDDATPFPVHSTVRHGEWGPGMVLGYEGDKMTVLFDEVGYKTLSVPVVRAQNLLTVVR
ncbi:MAG: ATP-dependent DNA helicase RecQ, partial [Catenulispora sp.]|nr:ATP-dependent DNA helicase RecQ [Catenulispora sp.]